ncbi:MAG: CaiB/BaiF CoA transferase family protein [Dehalococcoidia bacterium]
MAAAFPIRSQGALSGIRVVELAGQLGEWCGKLLAGMGADLIKVEPPGGSSTRDIGPFVADQAHPDRSLYFWQNNAGKRAVTLDLQQEQGMALLRRLIDGADLFLETLAPGEAEASGLDYETLAATNRRLIVCSITPFGPDGPYADLETTDLVSMALGGPMQSCGYDAEDGDLPPVRPGQYHSFHTAGHFACTGILAALYERELSGLGQHVEVAAHDCLAVTVEFANTHWYYAQQVLRRKTGRHAGVMPSARSQHLCADGHYVNLGIPFGAGWQMLLDLLDEYGLAGELEGLDLSDVATRFANAGRIYDVLQVLCAMHSADEIFHMGQRLGFTWGAVRAPEDWLGDPQADSRGFFVELEHPELGRSYTYPGAPFIAHDSPWQIRRRAPLVGEDNDAVYAELGLSPPDRADRLQS